MTLNQWLTNDECVFNPRFINPRANSQPFLLTKSQILETSIFWDLHISANVLWQILDELMNELKRQIVQFKDYTQTHSLLCILCLNGTFKIVRILKSSKIKKCTIHRIYHQLKKFQTKCEVFLKKTPNKFEQMVKYFRTNLRIFLTTFRTVFEHFQCRCKTLNVIWQFFLK